MKVVKLEDMVKGWFIGNFDPTLIKTNDVEVAVKEYKKDILRETASFYKTYLGVEPSKADAAKILGQK